MNVIGCVSEPSSLFKLYFRSLCEGGAVYAFPCNAEGHVDIDGLGERSRNDYFYARTVVGREVSMPMVCIDAASRMCANES
jgi:hypothetical protein